MEILRPLSALNILAIKKLFEKCVESAPSPFLFKAVTMLLKLLRLGAALFHRPCRYPGISS